MTDIGDAPLVPEVGASTCDGPTAIACDEERVREDIDALCAETAFVPLVSPKDVVRRQRTVMPNTD